MTKIRMSCGNLDTGSASPMCCKELCVACQS